jgi:four helix bundle protein
MSKPLESFQSRSFRFACAIVRLYLRLAARPSFPMHLARQLLRSGTSVGANLEEAKAGQTRRDMAAKFSIALKEARETRFWLRLMEATELVAPALIADLMLESQELIAVLTAARRKLNSSYHG